MALTRVSPALFQVSNNITSVTVGGSANTISLTFDASGVITGASNNAVSVANTAITGNIISSQITSVANTQLTGLIQAAQIGSANATLITSGTLPGARLPTGSVLQVVTATYSTSTNTTSGSQVDTGLTATITPTSATSKILVLTSCRIFGQPGTPATVILKRNATSLQTRSRHGLTDDAGSGGGDGLSTAYLDSPATTSATTYKVTFARQGGSGAVYAQLDNDMSTMTLMEISG